MSGYRTPLFFIQSLVVISNEGCFVSEAGISSDELFTKRMAQPSGIFCNAEKQWMSFGSNLLSYFNCFFLSLTLSFFLSQTLSFSFSNSVSHSHTLSLFHTHTHTHSHSHTQRENPLFSSSLLFFHARWMVNCSVVDLVRFCYHFPGRI